MVHIIIHHNTCLGIREMLTMNMNGDKESVEEWHLGKCQTELHVEVLHVRSVS